MKSNEMNRRRAFGVRAVFVKTLVLLGLLFALTPASAYAGRITPGTPAHGGTDEYSIQLPGGLVLVVDVVILGTDTQAQKTKKISDAINAAGGISAVVGGPLAFSVNVLGEVFEKVDATGEEIVMVEPSYPGPGTISIIDLHGALAGVNSTGAESTFSSALGFDGLQVSASVSFSALSSPTVEGVIADFYSQLLAGLPAPLQPLLSLDLAQDRILFALPPGQSNYFVNSSTTDTAALQSGGFQVVPEPSSFTLLGFGLAGLLAAGLILQRARGPRTNRG